MQISKTSVQEMIGDALSLAVIGSIEQDIAVLVSENAEIDSISVSIKEATLKHGYESGVLKSLEKLKEKNTLKLHYLNTAVERLKKMEV